MKKVSDFYRQYKKMYLKLLKNDFKSRYTGSYLGMIWGIIQPIVTILIYWFVFTVGLRNGARPDGTPYIIWMIAGIVPWFFFSDALGAGTNAFIEYSYLVKKLNFNIALLPVVKVGSSCLIHLIFLIFSTIIFNFYGYQANWLYLQLIYYLVCNVFLVTGVVMLTSSLTVYLRDISQLIAIIVQIGFWAIPIVWGPEVVGERLILIFKLNPVYYIIEGYRNTLIEGAFFWSQPLYTLYFWTFSIMIFVIGYYVFNKLKLYFADVL